MQIHISYFYQYNKKDRIYINIYLAYIFSHLNFLYTHNRPHSTYDSTYLWPNRVAYRLMIQYISNMHRLKINVRKTKHPNRKSFQTHHKQVGYFVITNYN